MLIIGSTIETALYPKTDDPLCYPSAPVAAIREASLPLEGDRRAPHTEFFDIPGPTELGRSMVK
jgi:hypothetical protein